MHNASALLRLPQLSFTVIIGGVVIIPVLQMEFPAKLKNLRFRKICQLIQVCIITKQLAISNHTIYFLQHLGIKVEVRKSTIDWLSDNRLFSANATLLSFGL